MAGASNRRAALTSHMKANGISLLPYPRSLDAGQAGQCLLSSNGRIVLEAGPLRQLAGPARRLQSALAEHAHAHWELASIPLPDRHPDIVLRIVEELHPPPPQRVRDQAYRLDITPERIVIQACSPAGTFYGVCTLAQIIQQYGRCLPTLHIVDWPDLPVRGVMLDISRDKVPTMRTLYQLVDMLASWKINQLQLYTEHTFAYHRHPDVWAGASPVTGDEVLALDAFCRERYIELVPNQTTFGHMERWLVHRRYAHLAETHDRFITPWGPMQGPFSLAPLDPGSIQLVRDLLDELLPYFSSTQINVNCDETHDVGQGRSRQECAKRGTHRVYLDYLLAVYREVSARQHTMQFWGDIIVEAPELVPQLPRDCVALEWGYEAGHPFDEHCALFAAAGIPFYVCPGTSAWNSLAGRTDNAVANLQNAARAALKHGAIGYLITDWGDHGHWQVLPVSFPGFAVGAACSWAFEANSQMDVPAVVSTFAFRDPTGNMGRVACDLGNVYRLPGMALHNASALFWILQWPVERIRAQGWQLDFEAALDAIDRAVEPLHRARMQRSDAGLILDEFENTIKLMRHACHRGQLAVSTGTAEGRAGSERLATALDEDMRDIIREYERIWLARNRPGGLADSVARLHTARADYAAVT